jgi:hypothetical protein
MNGITIGVICSAVGAVLGILGFIRYSNQDVKQETSNSTRVEIKLDYAITGINEIKSDIKDTKKDVAIIQDRLTRVEESTKSAHHRIDGLEKKEE